VQVNAAALYSGQYGYHYRQQPSYPVQYQNYPVQYQQQYAYPVQYQQGVNYYYPTAQQNFTGYYPVNHNYQNNATCCCPACGNPVYVVYMGEQQGNKNGLALLVVATLILIALDILFLRNK
jgi:hypothetical protein